MDQTNRNNSWNDAVRNAQANRNSRMLKVHIKEEKEDCPACHGTGRYLFNKETCMTCDGSGKYCQ